MANFSSRQLLTQVACVLLEMPSKEYAFLIRNQTLQYYQILLEHPNTSVISYRKHFLRFNTSDSIIHSTSSLASKYVGCCTEQYTPPGSKPGDASVAVALSFS